MRTRNRLELTNVCIYRSKRCDYTSARYRCIKLKIIYLTVLSKIQISQDLMVEDLLVRVFSDKS